MLSGLLDSFHGTTGRNQGVIDLRGRDPPRICLTCYGIPNSNEASSTTIEGYVPTLATIS
jgi:hypothetical protein